MFRVRLLLMGGFLLGLIACAPAGGGLSAVTPIPMESLDIASVEQLATATTSAVSNNAAVPIPTANAVTGALPSGVQLATPTPADANSVQVTIANPNADRIDTSIVPIATPTPLSIRLPEGEVLDMMMAQDAAMKPTPRAEFVQIDEEVPLLYFWELFEGYNPETGLILSDKLVSLDGRKVTMQGFMAPPLQLDLSWFQLTLAPMGACPFCASAETVLPDMVTVYPVNESVTYTWEGVRVTGLLEVGPASDPETGMYSLIRMYAEDVEVGVLQ